MIRFQVWRKDDPENPKSRVHAVCDVELEPGDELHVLADTDRKIGSLVPPVTAFANAISGSATFSVSQNDDAPAKQVDAETAETIP